MPDPNATNNPAAAAPTATPAPAPAAPAAPAAPVANPVTTVATPAGLKYPSGMNLDASVKASFDDLHAGKITQQQFLDGFFARAEELNKEAAKQSAEAQSAREKTWTEAMAADTEFGGAKLQETARAADKAMAHMSPDGALAKRVKELGLAKDPVFLRAFARIGRGLSEDSISGSAQALAAPKTREDFLRLMYPNS